MPSINNGCLAYKTGVEICWRYRSIPESISPFRHGANPMIKTTGTGADREVVVEERSAQTIWRLSSVGTEELERIVNPVIAARRMENEGLVSKVRRQAGF